jgi:hypothetical protein
MDSSSYTSSQIAIILLNGAIGGAVCVLIAHLVKRYTRHILAVILVAAAAFYVLFAARADAGSTWITVEVVGVALFGAMAIAGVRGSPWWLAAGWALHPIWDVALHYFGPGHSFAPASYAIACVSWDWITAGYIAYRITRDSQMTLTGAMGMGRAV